MATHTQYLRQIVTSLRPEQRDLLAALLAEASSVGPSPAIPMTPAAARSIGTRSIVRHGAPTERDRTEPYATPAARNGAMQISLFFFSQDTQADTDKYRLLLESAALADDLGFTAIWTPERHFDPFGGSYPNPSVLAAALAMVTRRIQLRAGSVVLPLHHPIRIAEEWAVVDNLSNGRVGLACASGWHLTDFVLASEHYDARKDATWRNLDIVQRLWKGEAVRFAGVNGQDVLVSTFPRPVQPSLPVWVTCSGSDETFRKAGALGAHLLTHLSAQSIADLEAHIAVYQKALVEHGHDPVERSVTVMLHTFVGDSDQAVKQLVRPPMYDYLRSNLGLHARQARARGGAAAISQFTPDDEQVMLEHAFDKFYEHRALFGGPATCADTIQRLRGVGVTEIACLVDFGLERERVLDGVRSLGALVSHSAEYADAAVRS